jgi:HEAT repeat protein
VLLVALVPPAGGEEDELDLALSRIADPALSIESRTEAVFRVARDSKDRDPARVLPALFRLVEEGPSPLRYAALDCLARFRWPGRWVEPAVAGWLDHLEGDVRFAAAEIYPLVGVTSPRAVDGLCKLLSDGHHRVRQRAAETLGEIGASSGAAIRSLVRALGDENDPVGRTAADALVGLGQEAVPAVVAALDDLNQDGCIRAIYVLGEIGPTARPWAKRIVACLDERSLDMHVEAEQALRRINAPWKLQYGVTKRRRRLEEIRELKLRLVRACRVLLGEAIRQLSLVPRVRPPGRPTDTFPPVLLTALTAVATHLAEPPVLEVLAAIQRAEADPEALRAVLRRIRETGDEVGPLVAALETGPPDVRKVAARALGRARDHRVLGPLHRALADEDEAVRLEARRALDRILLSPR